MGGLSCGVILAKRGYHVTVLEQGKQVGGCLQCFTRRGTKFETGMHFIGSADQGQILRALLDELKITKDIQLSELDRTGYNVISLNGRHYRIPNGRDAFIKQLTDYFPDSHDDLITYCDLVEKVAAASSMHSLSHTENDDAVNTDYLLQSIDGVLDHVIHDLELRNVLVGNLPLYAAERGKTPFSTHAFIADFYNKSAYRVVGGSDQIAQSMTRTIKKLGGQVFTSQRVVHIECNDQRATAVTTEKGDRFEGDLFISDLHPQRTIALVDSPLLRPAYRKRVNSIPNTVGAFTVYLKFKANSMPYMNYNFFGYRQASPWDCETYTEAEWPKGYLYMHTEKEVGEIISYMKFEDVERWKGTKVGHRGNDYLAFKRKHAERLIKAVEEEFPGLTDCIDSYYTSTPLTYLDYTGTAQGAMYGFAHDVSLGPAGRVQYKTKIPNLLLCGQNINSHGILGVLVGTKVVANSLLQDASSLPLQEKGKKVYILGGGLGGLFTGALLAKEGFRVTLLEKNKVIGGGLQTFRRHGVDFETGMHLLGGLRKGQSLYRLCRYLGIYDKMAFHDVDSDCMDQITYLSDGRTYRVPEGKEAFINYFSQIFPAERVQIQAYIDALYKMVDEIDFFYLRTGNEHVYTHSESFMWPADVFLAHYITDPKLRDILGYMNPMYGGTAGHTPAYVHALINVLYIEGPSRFRGNSQQMAEALANVIVDHGGEVIRGAQVTRLEIADKMITAIAYQHDGNDHLLSVEKGRGDWVVNSLHPSVLLSMTDSKVFPKSFRMRIAEAPNSYSSFCVFVIFKAEAFPYINHTCYFQEDYGRVWNYGDYDETDWPRGFMYMTPCENPQGTFATKMIINSIMPYSVVAKWADTKTGHRGADYEVWKEWHIQKVLARMEQLYPGFQDKIAYRFASSPLTIRDYYGEPDGALYGLFKDCENIMQSQISIYTKVQNLLMTGQNVNLHGFCGVPLTAINTAEAIVGLNTIVNKINQEK